MIFIESAKDALVRAMNGANGLNPPLMVDDVTLGSPEVWIQGDTNTRISVTADSEFYTGSDTFYYNRLRIYDFFAGHSIPGVAADYPNVLAAITAFYNKFQLPHDPNELVNSAISPGATTITLQGRSSSLMFVPNLQVILPFSG